MAGPMAPTKAEQTAAMTDRRTAESLVVETAGCWEQLTAATKAGQTELWTAGWRETVSAEPTAGRKGGPLAAALAAAWVVRSAATMAEKRARQSAARSVLRLAASSATLLADRSVAERARQRAEWWATGTAAPWVAAMEAMLACQ